ncbi:hypothetical protein M6D81_19210 [Paenibacillus sp. J5C_2022]|uniref:hypothetical protein n=1 Tax=Paenibacillus sp. J5C2022 TaxID=2977129 RepID=UPI0021D01BD1|nr:hypothetical protein [Paenibacillus sp. J5C2022]MCU6710826.1 hypothetical protein [Paenibacillus sp. J5C2022]
MGKTEKQGSRMRLLTGWAEVDLTPAQPVILSGQFHARLSEGVADPIQATVWALESGREQAVFVGCDLFCISDELSEAVVARLDVRYAETGLDPRNVMLHATHTHTAPEIQPHSGNSAHAPGGDSELKLDALAVEAYVSWTAERLAQAIVSAWLSRAPGGIAYGIGHAVVGHNRRWVNDAGRAAMYALLPEVNDTFRHIEGFEEHSVHVASVYDSAGTLTGVVVNVPCPSQASEADFVISADYWHEARQELRRRLGEHLFILPQCSAAGEQTPTLLFGKQPYERMLRLKGRTARDEIAHRLASAVEEVVAVIGGTIDYAPCLRHSVETVELPLNELDEADASEAAREAELWRAIYEQERSKLERSPELCESPRWYVDATHAYFRNRWNGAVVRRHERQRAGLAETITVHVVRLGDVVFSTNPYELYVDYGIQLQVRSPALQTFIVQLAGPGTYVPSPRSTAGGGYGSVPASNPVGPEGGQQLVDTTVRLIRALWV